MENKSRIIYLFFKYFDDIATAQEKKELEGYLHTSEENVKDLMEDAWKRYTFDKNVFTPLESEAMLQYVLQTQNRIAKRKTMRLRVAAAAGIAFILGISTIWFYNQRIIQDTPTTANTIKQNYDFDPGGNKAILTLGDGSEIILNSADSGILTNQGHTKVLKSKGGQLEYRSTNNKDAAIVLNTLTTPRAGQYELVLADGTKVWLNAASSITYPTEFKGNRRTVELKGEGYFEVAKNTSKPFYVKVNDMEVMVLGTHFNINAYADEPFIRTTLLEGSVKVSNGFEQKLLTPGQAAIVSTSIQSIGVSKANVEQSVAWKNGYFNFERASLQEVMRQVARWYDVDVRYEGNIPEREFVGEIPRGSKASEVLGILRLSKINYRLEGKQIIITP